MARRTFAEPASRRETVRVGASSPAPAAHPPAIVAGLVSQALGVDRATGRRVLRASRLASVRCERDQDRRARPKPDRTAGSPPRGSSSPPPTLDWPGADVWSRALQADGATLHLGCWLSALLALADQLRWLGRITVIRRWRDGPRQSDALREPDVLQVHRFEHIGLELAVVQTRDHPAQAALRALRRGEHVLLLFDSPPGFDAGRTAPVSFFGRPAHMANGPAQLAAHAGALLWPVAMPMVDGCLRMRTREPLAPDSRPACQAATRTLVRFAEECILEAPEQWLLWTHLPALWGLPCPSSSDPLAPRLVRRAAEHDQAERC